MSTTGGEVALWISLVVVAVVMVVGTLAMCSMPVSGASGDDDEGAKVTTTTKAAGGWASNVAKRRLVGADNVVFVPEVMVAHSRR